MQIKFTSKGTTLVVSIIGELDHHSAEYIRQKVDSEIVKSANKNIIFDMSRVTFMDSSGIGVILGRFKNVQRLNGKTAIVQVNDQVRRIFDMSGVMKLIPIYDNIESAMGYFC